MTNARSRIGGPLLPGGMPSFDRSLFQSQQPSPLWGLFKAPLPTNVWWTNLVTGEGDQPVFSLPYMVSARSMVRSSDAMILFALFA